MPPKVGGGDVRLEKRNHQATPKLLYMLAEVHLLQHQAYTIHLWPLLFWRALI